MFAVLTLIGMVTVTSSLQLDNLAIEHAAIPAQDASTGEQLERSPGPADQLAAKKFISTHAAHKTLVQADYFGQLALFDDGYAVGHRLVDSVDPLITDDGAWVFADTTNVHLRRARGGTGTSVGVFVFPMRYFDTSRSVLYSSGSDVIFGQVPYHPMPTPPPRRTPKVFGRGAMRRAGRSSDRQCSTHDVARGCSMGDGSVVTRASIVIPVLDEAGAVARLLTSLRDAAPHQFAVVVVCNGCTDNSAEVARSFPDVIVDELTERSKTKALNRGDQLADDLFPRFYMDADIEVDVASLLAIVDALTIDQPAAAGPSTHFLIAGKPWSVRSYYFTMDRLPSHQAWRRSHLSGRGVYATNRAGRERFGAFPELRDGRRFSSTSCSTTASGTSLRLPWSGSMSRTARASSSVTTHGSRMEIASSATG